MKFRAGPRRGRGRGAAGRPARGRGAPVIVAADVMCGTPRRLPGGPVGGFLQRSA
ncbi:hypothetical protein GCM10010261_24700 [Streptomyces pilosus]|uniref:Uncharacterized protein n=1 Tax=Streptomyces pilosus TaxID=28893 RepID=A0A918BYK2_9ACTN|nr:hypothetical protein GCM10010280_48760 [Streptomyces pilosus]GGV48029.1 hypothetical protein GCM10010261_24700 [Streptomyces pilosus]